MPFLTVEELYTHLYEEVVNEISRSDADKPAKAINAAVEEAKGYLTAYDTDVEFAKTDDDRNPVLLMYIKDIAVFHFITVCNVNADYEQKLKRYDMAISWLGKVQSGKTNPNLAAIADPTDGTFLENRLHWGSNLKRPTNY